MPPVPLPPGSLIHNENVDEQKNIPLKRLFGSSVVKVEKLDNHVAFTADFTSPFEIQVREVVDEEGDSTYEYRVNGGTVYPHTQAGSGDAKLISGFDWVEFTDDVHFWINVQFSGDGDSIITGPTLVLSGSTPPSPPFKGYGATAGNYVLVLGTAQTTGAINSHCSDVFVHHNPLKQFHFYKDGTTPWSTKTYGEVFDGWNTNVPNQSAEFTVLNGEITAGPVASTSVVRWDLDGNGKQIKYRLPLVVSGQIVCDGGSYQSNITCKNGSPITEFIKTT